MGLAVAHAYGDGETGTARVRHAPLLNGNAGTRAAAPGAYGHVTLNGGSGLILGTTGNLKPDVYHFQSLTLNGQSRIQVAGPVVVTVAGHVVVNGTFGSPGDPGLLTLNLHSGNLTLNGAAAVHGHVLAPNGTVTLNGNSRLVGGVTADRLAVNGNGLLQLVGRPTENQLPYFTSFEAIDGYVPGSLDGQVGWAAKGDVEVSDNEAYEGAYSAIFSPGEPPSMAELVFLPYEGEQVVFVDAFFRLAATPMPEPVLETDVARIGFVHAGAGGELQVFDGDGFGGGVWRPVGVSVQLDEAGRAVDWVRITLREDYDTKRWDLYADGRLVAFNLGFSDLFAASFTRLAVSGHGTTSIAFDDVYAGFENPLFEDADKDGMDDAWELAHGLDPTINDRDGDLDGDGLTNIQEFSLGTAPDRIDTDGDGLPDWWEVKWGTNPLVDDADADPDGDGLTNAEEYALGRNPLKRAVPDTADAVNLRVYAPGP